MQVIRGLMVDDEQRDQRRPTTRLNTRFEKFGRQAHWETQSEPDEGQGRIRRADPPYDVVLADLLLAREDLPDRCCGTLCA
ncbi:hypothetical protein [Streptomyces sp. NPDC058371]|uniref:hypothetical protein n=1 Tax=Streptomyces sp. NPDC058371 TaxID=3346463 RepID=UPI003651DF1C